ncbi:Flp family type IVb pilin [Arthrobacter sp. AB6]|uniref:Flp family type IVb pilin n=1 Tax=Arthrobacter sp. AB6 TaxID=2962570 RepID=UPI0028821D71|nr:Flp family type IVb pilin [Arthrobacter sp. AB6]MDT0195015.1 Flp family type IVb pilin [Arthrobacter sp. AB6]
MTSLMVSMTAFIAGIKDRLASEKGATAVEYGLMVALIAVFIITAVALVGTNLDAIFNEVAGELTVVSP